MKIWIGCLVGMFLLAFVAAYAEFVLDFRGPRSQIGSEVAIAAITETFYGDRDKKLKEARTKYGDRVVANDSAFGGTTNGKWTIHSMVMSLKMARSS